MIKKLFFLIGNYFFVNFIVSAQTIIPGGLVSGSWTKANSPYQIQGSITIADNSTLIIQPGVSVIFMGGYKFLVLGRLLAVGTVTDTITFTAADTSTGWRGIRFDNTPATNDSSKLFYCKLTYGKASSTGEDYYGGSFYFRNFSNAIISHSHISNCDGRDYGGGFYCENSSPFVSNNTISNNSAFRGGGFCCYYNSNPFITKNTFINNYATSVGGAIFCYSSSPTISDNTISNNSAYRGGGIYCWDNSNPTIFNNAISNNSASSDGGGIVCYRSNSKISTNMISNNSGTYGGGINCNECSPIISNNTISNNSGTYGSGIWCLKSNPTIDNNTISNNTAPQGGALYCGSSSNPILHNTLIWGNTASTTGNQVYLNDDSCDPNFYFCDLQGGKTGFGLNSNVFYFGTYSNNIDSDPLFVDTTPANWSLQSGSPCINSGDPTGTYPPTDEAGNPRICDSRIDIGAYEYQKSPCTINNIATDKSEKQISVFPNPTCGKFQLAIGNMQLAKGELTIYNLFGENVFQSKFFNPINEIDASSLADQIYLVRLKINEQVYLKKICKIK